MKKLIVLFGLVAAALTVFSAVSVASPERAVWRGHTLAADTAGDDQEETVYITKTGSKYHLSGCRYLKKSKIPISEDDAISRGYAP